MKRKWLLLLLLMLCIPALYLAHPRFVLNINEIILSRQGHGVNLSNAITTSAFDGTEAMGKGMTVSSGAVLENSVVQVTFGGGIGFLDFDLYGIGMLFAESEMLFKAAPELYLGPRATFIEYSGSCFNSSDIHMRPKSNGYQIGFIMVFPSEQCDISLGINYQHGVFELEDKGDHYSENEDLDISGIAFQYGIKFRS